MTCSYFSNYVCFVAMHCAEVVFRKKPEKILTFLMIVWEASNFNRCVRVSDNVRSVSLRNSVLAKLFFSVINVSEKSKPLIFISVITISLRSMLTCAQSKQKS